MDCLSGFLWVDQLIVGVTVLMFQWLCFLLPLCSISLIFILLKRWKKGYLKTPRLLWLVLRGAL